MSSYSICLRGLRPMSDIASSTSHEALQQPTSAQPLLCFDVQQRAARGSVKHLSSTEPSIYYTRILQAVLSRRSGGAFSRRSPASSWFSCESRDPAAAPWRRRFVHEACEQNKRSRVHNFAVSNRRIDAVRSKEHAKIAAPSPLCSCAPRSDYLSGTVVHPTRRCFRER